MTLVSMKFKRIMPARGARSFTFSLASWLLILCFFAKLSESNPDRDRRKHSLPTDDYYDLMDHGRNGVHDDHDDDSYGYGRSSLLGDHLAPQSVCEPIKIGMCMGIGYNQTTMPNQLGHDGQADAEIVLQSFAPLIQYGCSSNLKLFLCSAYVPMCHDKVPQPIGPCRPLCESVRAKCEPVLKEFGFEWAKSLECSQFPPRNNHQHMCNPGPTESSVSSYGGGRGTGGSLYHGKRDPHSSQGSSSSSSSSRYPSGTIYGKNKESPSSVPATRVNGNHPWLSAPKSGKSDHEQMEGETNSGTCKSKRKVWLKDACWLKCTAASFEDDSIISLFNRKEKGFARNYALFWALLSLCTAFLALVLSVCSRRFSVAERPILYLALCQVLFSIGVIIGSTSSVSCFLDKSTGSNLLARGGMIPSSCALVFLLTYFFGTATTMWWVILCLSWLLSLNRDMATSLMHKESSLFHLVTWGVASLLTSTALVHKKVDADELTGICGVGFQDLEALRLYNVTPLSISLAIGLGFLTIGVVLRVFFPDWNLPLPRLKLFKGKNESLGQNRMMNGCELSNNSAATTTASHQTGQTHTQLQSSFRSGPHGYSPVLVMPSATGFTNPSHHHHPHLHQPQQQQFAQGHFANCMCSVGSTCIPNNNNNGLLYSTGNSPASVVGAVGTQRLRALESTKAIWMRIGIFALVHSLPIACQLGTMVYELSGREDWEQGNERPNLQIFLIRLNMNLIAGLTTGVWVLSTFSWKSLLTFGQRLCNCLQFPKKPHKSSQAEKIAVAHHTSVVAPLLGPATVSSSVNVNVNANPPRIPIPSGSSSSSNNNHNSTMPILSSNNTFTTRGPIAVHNIPSANFPRHHYNHPLPPVPPRNPDHIAFHQQQQQQQRTDAWRPGETIV